MEVAIGSSYPRSLATNYWELSVLTIGIIIGAPPTPRGQAPPTPRGQRPQLHVDNWVGPPGQVSVISVAVVSMVRGSRRGMLTSFFRTGGGEFQSTKPPVASISTRAFGYTVRTVLSAGTNFSRNFRARS